MENKKLESILNKWIKLQPLNEYDQNRLSRRFTIDFNYNSNQIADHVRRYAVHAAYLIDLKFAALQKLRLIRRNRNRVIF